MNLFEFKEYQVKNKSPLFKIYTLILILLFLIVPIYKIDKNVFSIETGVYICGPASCTDPSPNHLSYYCDDYH